MLFTHPLLVLFCFIFRIRGWFTFSPSFSGSKSYLDVSGTAKLKQKEEGKNTHKNVSISRAVVGRVRLVCGRMYPVITSAMAGQADPRQLTHPPPALTSRRKFKKGYTWPCTRNIQAHSCGEAHIIQIQLCSSQL